jgi:hypothetical protein
MEGCEMKDITVILKDSPGTLADLCEVLSGADINIEGISVVTYKGECPIHILVKDGEAARKNLEAHWMEVISDREALIINIADQPGALEKIARTLASSGINIEVSYLTIKGSLALVVDDLPKARSLLEL